MNKSLLSKHKLHFEHTEDDVIQKLLKRMDENRRARLVRKAEKQRAKQK